MTQGTTDDTPQMNDRELALIRHIAGKALVESDEIDAEKFSLDDIETAMWTCASDVSMGTYFNHPDNIDDFKENK